MKDSELEERIKDANAFLKKLKANNNREWFTANKSDYAKSVKQTGQDLLVKFADVLEPMIGAQPTKKMFRINRDVRFSKDKTPYNTHLHLLWNDGSGPGFFFGASPEYVTAGCGIMGLQKERLDAYRNMVDAHGNQLAEAVNALTKKGFRMGDAELKRVPAPFAKDHPQSEFLRRKSLVLWFDFENSDLTVNNVTRCFEDLMPIYRLCQKIV